MKPPSVTAISHKRDLYDLVIAGAGPAGCAAATAAADAGLSVLIVEKSTLPRAKTCGGLLSSRAAAQLPGGLKLDGLPSLPVHEILVSTLQKSYVYRYRQKEPVGIVTLRCHLDAELAFWACSRGARLMENSALRRLDLTEASRDGLFRLETQRKTVWSRYLIGADGALSTTARLAGIREKFPPWQSGFAISTLVKTPAPHNDKCQSTISFYPLPLLGGFGWSFPGPGYINIGAGGWYPFRSKIINFFDLLNRKTAAESGGKVSKPRSWIIPFSGILATIHRGRVLLAGDAAGITDPFAGEGICHALKSGRMAAEAIIREEKAEAENCGAYYSRSIRRELSAAFYLSMAASCILRWPLIGNPLSKRVSGGLAGIIAGIMSQPDWYRRNLIPLLTPFNQLREEG